MAAAVIVKGGLGGSLKFRAELEGLRGLLILLIAFYHAGFSLFESAFFSVDAFFVLSGYLMAAIITSERQSGRFSLLGFYERRARRLLPALYLVLLVGVALAYFVVPPPDYRDFAESGIWSMLMAGNIFFANTGPGYFGASIELSPFMHFWSLGIEQQYYLLIPILFLLFSGRLEKWFAAAIFMLALISLFVAISMVQDGGAEQAYYYFVSRVWEFLVGALAALRFDSIRRLAPRSYHAWLSDLGLVLLVGSCFFLSSHALHPGVVTLVPVTGVLLLLCFAAPHSLSVRFLSIKPLVFLGVISYSIYLWHQVLLALGRWLFMDAFGAFAVSLLLVTSVLLSIVTCRYIENPLRDRQLVPTRVFWCGTLVSAVLLFSLMNYIDNKNGLRDRLPMAFVEETLRKSGMDVSTTLDDIDCSRLLHFDSPCPIGVPGLPRTWVIVGDSHAAQLVASFDSYFRATGRAGYVVARNGCAFADTNVRLIGDYRGECQAYNKELQEWLLNNKVIDSVVVAGRIPYFTDRKRYNNGAGAMEGGRKVWFEPIEIAGGVDDEAAVLSSFIKPIERLLENDKKVVLIYPMPEFGWDVPRYFMRQVLRGDERIDISIKFSVYEQRVEPFRRAVGQMAQQSSLLIVDPTDVFCDNGRCNAYRDGRLLYRDDDHLTRYGTDLLVDKLVVDLGLDSLTNRIVTRF